MLTLVVLSLFISACSDDTREETPAQGQINEYTKQLKDCKDKDVKNQEKKEELSAAPKKFQPPERDFTIALDDMVLGNPNSKTVLIEYFSPTCPHCVNYHNRTFPEIQKKYIDTNKIAYVFREFIGNKQDLDATILARCKGDIGNYMKFIDIILKQQDNWAYNKNYREILTNIGGLGSISAEEYAACLNDEDKIKILVENTKLVARSPNFAGTPSFFINGKYFTKPYTFEELSTELDAYLANSQ